MHEAPEVQVPFDVIIHMCKESTCTTAWRDKEYIIPIVTVMMDYSSIEEKDRIKTSWVMLEGAHKAPKMQVPFDVIIYICK